MDADDPRTELALVRSEPALLRSLPGVRGWPAPYRVTVEGGLLRYEWGDPDLSVPQREAEPEPRMFGQFLRLGDASDQRIAHYAQRWGALGVGEGHQASWEFVVTERIEDWRRWATEARSIAQIGGAIHGGNHAPPEMVKLLVEADPRVTWPTRERAQRSLPAHRRDKESWAMNRNLAGHVNRWLWLGNVSLEFTWGEWDGEPEYGVRSPSLFGVIALLIAAAVNDSAQIVTCSNCGRLYTPKRKPARGRRNYCDDPACKKTAASKFSKRSTRQKNRVRSPSVIALSSDPSPRTIDPSDLVGAAEISDRLGVARPGVVHEWRRRHEDFPQPVAHLRQTLVWSWPDIEEWARSTGRLKNAEEPR